MQIGDHILVCLQEFVMQLSSSGSLVCLKATTSNACYLLAGAGWDWVRILLELNFSGIAGGVSVHGLSHS